MPRDGSARCAEKHNVLFVRRGSMKKGEIRMPDRTIWGMKSISGGVDMMFVNSTGMTIDIIFYDNGQPIIEIKKVEDER
jgi:hypothetical protein